MIDHRSFTKKILTENPVLVMAAGICPAVAVTDSAYSGLLLGCGTLLVLLLSSLPVTLMKSIIPEKAACASHIIIIAAITSVIQMLFSSWFPYVTEEVGIFIPLIAVNCIVIESVNGFARNNPALPTLFNGLGAGMGFLIILLLMGIIRESIGKGTLFGDPVFAEDMTLLPFAVLLPGGFFLLSLLAALIKHINRMISQKQKNAKNNHIEEEEISS
ncbi:MAG TPA: Rnf-Nqr domain containing protein [Bacillota bacterium]|nr:Rnf-Nqr domain containing protein [Bacillota bacterium]HUM55906.1 Rnf-Nqr domain containing protein [Bacillota bacterium]